MNKIRFSSLALAGTLSLSLLLSACGGKDAEAAPTPEVSETPAVTESVKPSEPPSAEPPEPTESPAPTETSEVPAPTQTPKPTQKPQPTPTPKPAEPTQKPSEPPAAEASKVQAVWDGISAKVQLSFEDLDDDILSALYGISSDDLVEYIGKIPRMNVQATEFFIAQVKSGRMDAVKSGITQRQSDLEAQWQQYLPAQLELVENYKLVTNGDYVLFAISENADDIVSIFNDCTK